MNVHVPECNTTSPEPDSASFVTSVWRLSCHRPSGGSAPNVRQPPALPSHLVSLFLLHRERFAPGRSGLGSDRLALGGRAQAPGLVGDADQEHGLACVFQEIDDSVGRFFQIDALAVGQQMNVGSGGQRLTQALARILLQKPEHAADSLQREALAAQLGNHRDFYYLFAHIDALVTVLAGRDDFPLVPPLQLPKADAANSGHIAADVALLPRCGGPTGG